MKYGFVYDKKHKCWRHRTKLKCFINPILRKIQFWTDKPFVIASCCEMNDGKPKFIKYRIARIKYERSSKIN